MIKSILPIFLSLISFFTVIAQEPPSHVIYRLQLTDKNGSEYSIERPEEFLSQKAIDRRLKYNIAVDETDLPLSATYIKKLEDIGCTVVAKSKWLNTVSVLCSSSLYTYNQLAELPFVNKVTLVYNKAGLVVSHPSNILLPIVNRGEKSVDYGLATEQIKIHNGDFLHSSGYKGQGMTIAILDGGFATVDDPSSSFNNISIVGTKSFVYNQEEVYAHTFHGTNVLSCIAGNYAGRFVGSAPEADYWLFCSEDMKSEYPVEEDYWVTAAEYADSVGVDLINSSLGYSTFNDPSMSFTYESLDGKTTHITKGADMAAGKGIFVVSSAGNEGNTGWKYIQAPADGEQVFTVGAVRVDSLVGFFSSRGPTYDGRIKPDVMAVGEQTAIMDGSGYVSKSNGTSYAAPIMTGLVACLWQANPHLNNKEIADIIRRSSDRYTNPDADYGYGIPDMKKAMKIVEESTGIENNVTKLIGISVRTISSQRKIIVSKDSDNGEECVIRIYATDGKEVLSDRFSGACKSYNLGRASCNKVFIVHLQYQNNTKSHKICF